MAKAKKAPTKKMPPPFMKKGAAKETTCPDCGKAMKGKKCSCGYEAK
jgi:hypothetical protein